MMKLSLPRLKAEDILFYFSGAIAGAILSTISILFVGKLSPALADILYAVSGILSFLPFTIRWYSKFNKKKKIESNFPVFLRDFIESVRSGMNLPQAFKTVSVNDYGYLSPYVKKMSAQLNWGIPIGKVLLNFSIEAKSKLIGRIVSAVIESHNFGGNLTDTFEALSKTVLEVDKLRKERFLYLQAQLMTGYIVFFVFLAVIIGLQLFLTPSLTALPTGGLGQPSPETKPEEIAKQYNEMYRNLILIQGLFAGLSIGKMSEGSMMAGIKHSLFMMFIGFVTFSVMISTPEVVPLPIPVA